MFKHLIKSLFVLALTFQSCQAFAQSTSKTFTLDSGTQTSTRLDLRKTGVSALSFNWNANGTVSAGSCALEGSMDDATYGTTIIAAQVVTASGGPTAVATNITSNFVHIDCTTPIAGSGSVDFRIMGWVPNPAFGTITLDEPLDVNIFSSSHASIEPSSDPCYGQSVTPFTVHSVTGAITTLVTASPTFKVYICGLWIIVGAAHNVAIVEDNDSGCVSPTGLVGGATAATGLILTGNGIAMQRGGGMVTVTSAVNRYVCMITATTTPTTILFTYVLAE